MSWAIDIPYRDRDDMTLSVISAARETMGADDRGVVEVIASDARARGTTANVSRYWCPMHRHKS